MKLVAKSGREIELNEEQANEYRQLILLKGEAFAKAAAFDDQLPAQRGNVCPSLDKTLDVVSKMAAIKRQKMRERRKAYRQGVLLDQQMQKKHEHVIEALKQMAPNLHRYSLNRIFKRSKRVFQSDMSFSLAEARPVDWHWLNGDQQAEAMAKAKELLRILNLNDWLKIKQLNTNQDLQELILYANPIALSGLL